MVSICLCLGQLKAAEPDKAIDNESSTLNSIVEITPNKERNAILLKVGDVTLELSSNKGQKERTVNFTWYKGKMNAELFNALDLGRALDLDSAALKTADEKIACRLLFSAKERVHKFNDNDLCAECGKCRAELEAYNSAADDTDLLRKLGKRKSTRAVETKLVAGERNSDRRGTGCDDDVLVSELLKYKNIIFIAFLLLAIVRIPLGVLQKRKAVGTR